VHHRSASHSRLLAIFPLPTGTLRLVPTKRGVRGFGGVPCRRLSWLKVEKKIEKPCISVWVCVFVVPDNHDEESLAKEMCSHCCSEVE
jgi:hypothetical protein